MKKSIMDVVHETAKGLYDAGLMGVETMRTFDAMRLTPVHDMKPREIKRLRLREKVSQSVFAMYLNSSPSTVKKWETGEKHPVGTSLKLLNLIERKGLAAVA
ncbi:MAG: DNA-binding transcriptional regulator [Gammaproteobacteria bacterium]|nr:DNA-binding transcriptional regulator [Gammaproteobacteria bacterium]